ncbi:MAG TPA: hypothetical protein DCK98_11535 [Chloroflexi bacterium]|jgi:hypothetical protein|nr:hypothetical protein [Chloroflexota bacterium]HAL28144.1 hypothetical protein [Chloroflexota bacterium]
MSSERVALRALNLITQADTSEIRLEAVGPVDDLRSILGSKNVVGIGIAEKVSKRGSAGKLAVTFYVERKKSKKNLKADDFIPPVLHPELTGGEPVLTDVVQLGKIGPEVNAVNNPIQPGNSVGHAGEDAAGTLGAIVTSGKGQRCQLLSNSHVLAKSGKAKAGDGAVLPGRLDGGKVPNDIVGKLAKWSKWKVGGQFVNTVDVAVATVVPARSQDLNAAIRTMSLVSSTIAPKRGMKVVKVGRTTGKTTGTIRDIHFRFVLNYPGVGKVGYRDQILVTRFTKPGDSGSLVVDQKSKKAVGLHFAGASGGSVSNPIDAVLKTMGVRLAAVKNPCAGKPRSGRTRRGNA